MERHLGKYDYYEILEVKKNAPQNEISKAYERSKSTYSSTNPAIYTIFSDQEAKELMKMVEEAYSVIGNKILRSIYDEKIQDINIRGDDLSLEGILKSVKTTQAILNKVDLKLSYIPNDGFEQEIKTCHQWDGSFLRKVREYKCVSIDRMNKITKINPFYIQGIEDMNPSNLPAIVFIRGYVVQIARALQLDDKLVSDSYMKLIKEKLNK